MAVYPWENLAHGSGRPESWSWWRSTDDRVPARVEQPPMAQPAWPELWRDVCKTNWHPAQLSSLTVHSSQVLLLSGAPAPAFLFPDTTNIFAELRSFAPRVLCSLLPAKCLAVHSTHIQVIDTRLTCKHVQLCTLCLGYKCNKLDLLNRVNIDEI